MELLGRGVGKCQCRRDQYSTMGPMKRSEMVMDSSNGERRTCYRSTLKTLSDPDDLMKLIC